MILDSSAWLEEATIAFYLRKLSTDMAAAAAAAEVAQKLAAVWCGFAFESCCIRGRRRATGFWS